MSTPTVRVVTAGWPSMTYVAIDHPREHAERPERELLSDDVPSIEAGMKLAETKLRERGLEVGAWEPIGPLVRQAPVLGGGA